MSSPIPNAVETDPFSEKPTPSLEVHGHSDEELAKEAQNRTNSSRSESQKQYPFVPQTVIDQINQIPDSTTRRNLKLILSIASLIAVCAYVVFRFLEHNEF